VRYRSILPAGTGFPRIIPVLILLGMIFIPFPRPASADSIHGLLEYIYSTSTIETKDIFGVTSKIKSDGFSQRYNLAFDRTIYPSLILSGGGLFEDFTQNGTTDGIETKSDATRLSPYIDLLLKNPFISSGVGYRRREDTASANGVQSPKQIQDLYSANLGWHPSELPSIDVYLTRRYLYDEKRTSQDIQTDNYTWTSDYRAIKGLELSYNGNYTDVKNNLINSETQSLTNSGRITYSGSLLNNKVFFHSSYSFAMQESSITSKSAAKLYVPKAALNTVFIENAPSQEPPSIPPSTVQTGQLPPLSQARIVNQISLVTTTSITTVNNLGLYFSTPTTVNTLFLRVSQVKTINNTNLPLDVLKGNAAFSNVFTWTIFTSADGITWNDTPQIITNAEFNSDPSSPGSSNVGFILNINPVTTQYIMIVEAPPLYTSLPVISGSIINSVQADNLLAFTSINAKPGTSVKSSNIGGIYDMNVKALILDSPNLSYDMSYTFTHNKSDQSPLATSYLLTNGLSLAHRLSDIISTNARLTDEFSSDTQSRMRNAIAYNAGIAVTPLPTLSHSLVYGGRIEFFEGQTSLTNSVYLNNNAELYKGLSLNTGAGYSIATAATGQKSDSLSLTVGAEIVPNRNITLSLSYQDTTSNQSGGGHPDQSTFNRSATATATYRPFEALYLTGSYSIFMQNNQDTVNLQNFGVSWSPFRGGDLQFNFTYNEALNSSGNEKVRNISPALRWNIRPGSTLDVSYNILESRSDTTGTTNAESFGAQLRIAF